MHRFIFKEILTIMVILSIPVVTIGQELSTDSKPEYGGKLAYALTWIGEHPDSWYIGHRAIHYVGLVNEKLVGEWGIDREEDGWYSTNEPPSTIEALAESWEQPDQLTTVFKIRKGVHWQNKAPMNGRELTALDVEWNYHRFTGLGNFSEAGPSPIVPQLANLPLESITATDNWTVEIKLNQPDLSVLPVILGDLGFFILPSEVIEQHGDLKDWRNLVGTGPYELKDVLEGRSLTWTRNPDYWDVDEKYQGNRLPYIDEITAHIMPNQATRLAALRTGLIDFLGTVGDSQISINKINSLRRTNPEIIFWPFRSNNSLVFGNLNKPPFDDINVRHAMQLALDNENIAKTYWRGYADPIPQGLTKKTGYFTPFEEWPEEVKKSYRYDPGRAKQLLANAGYSKGFKTTLDFAPLASIAYAELAADYWAKIGVKVKINVLTNAEYHGKLFSSIYEGMASADSDYTAMMEDQLHSGSMLYLPGAQRFESYDPVYGAIAAMTSKDMHEIAQYPQLWLANPIQYNAHQPWVRGYNGETSLGPEKSAVILARLWIEQQLKKEME